MLLLVATVLATVYRIVSHVQYRKQQCVIFDKYER
jgi:hypothetical protein